jgi:hypothetical protein
VEWWDRGFTKFNGTVFEDPAFDGKEFQTYKLGLCLWTARQINYTQYRDFRRPGLAGLEEDMWRMQSKPSVASTPGTTRTSTPSTHRPTPRTHFSA